jgi:hypothetical protein
MRTANQGADHTVRPLAFGGGKKKIHGCCQKTVAVPYGKHGENKHRTKALPKEPNHA